MTDRVFAFTVLLREPTRIDDAHQLMSAMAQFGNVLSVVPHRQDAAAFWAKEAAKQELAAQILQILMPSKGDEDGH